MTAVAIPATRAASVRRFAAFGVGAAFGLVLSWSGMTNPDVLRDGLLFRDAYLMLFFASALATTFVGLRVSEGPAGTRPADRRAGELDDGQAGAPPRRRQRAVRHGLGARRRVPRADRRATRAGRARGASATAAGLVVGVWLYLRRT